MASGQLRLLAPTKAELELVVIRSVSVLHASVSMVHHTVVVGSRAVHPLGAYPRGYLGGMGRRVGDLIDVEV